MIYINSIDIDIKYGILKLSYIDMIYWYFDIYHRYDILLYHTLCKDYLIHDDNQHYCIVNDEVSNCGVMGFPHDVNMWLRNIMQPYGLMEI